MNRNAMSGIAVSGIAIALVLAFCGPGLWPASAEDRGPSETSNSASEKPASEAPQSAEDSAGSEAGSDDDMMNQFTRHRPGGCPEGPPCKFED